MPDQIKRLLIIIVIVAVGFIFVRRFFVPKTFGEYGHYRAAAVDSIAALNIQYASHHVCAECHDDIDAKKKKSFHKNVNCEACHGPAEDHIQSLGDIIPPAPRDRGYCILCHEYNPARPTGFPQINPVMHNPVKACIACHDPHAPEPPRIPGDCSACHATIARTKVLSPHALLECTQCHTVPEEHRVNPRASLATKPSSRSDCGVCHAVGADSDRLIPRVNLASHGEGYLCWQCHYPHFPEVGNE